MPWRITTYFQSAVTDHDIFSGPIHRIFMHAFSTKIPIYFGKIYHNPSFGIQGMQHNPFTHVFIGGRPRRYRTRAAALPSAVAAKASNVADNLNASLIDVSERIRWCHMWYPVLITSHSDPNWHNSRRSFLASQDPKFVLPWGWDEISINKWFDTENGLMLHNKFICTDIDHSPNHNVPSIRWNIFKNKNQWRRKCASPNQMLAGTTRVPT